ncbi:unnamed protein product [Spirodela intermedia]|uniref:Uncharacterized protein n=1 Tax=Spirodela intermedia TaxID=51605 RepID=A0A7I8JGU5_SPIIN|nr:unnamed protein product [Spirodela intermedia]CAA6668622.1 unnamed protein product [Spirodela intermedia]
MGLVLSSICLPLNELLLSPLKTEKVGGPITGQALLLKDKAEQVAALKDQVEQVAALKDQVEQVSLPEAVTAGTQEVRSLLGDAPSTSLLEPLTAEKTSDILGKKLNLF